MEKLEGARFCLEGLNCAHCAGKIEEEVGTLSGVKSARVDFAQQRLVLETLEGEGERIFEEAKRLIKEIEPHVTLLKQEEAGHGREGELALKEALKSPRFLLFALGSLFFALAVFPKTDPSWDVWIYLVAYGLIGGEILLLAFRNILRGQVFDENFLMSLATIGAFAIGEYPEGVAVMFFYRIGEFFQDLAVERSRKSITSLMGIRPEFARLKEGEELLEVEPASVLVGSTILVRPGERVPLDGVILLGNSTLDLSALTGESLPKEVSAGDEILSGAINKTGVLEVRTTKSFGESTVAKILDLVQNASAKKAKTEQFITKFARYYTPFVVISAVLLAFLPPLLIEGALLEEWFRRSLVFLVVSCPCALVVSIPLTFFAGIGGASKAGILIKGGNFLEALHEVDTVVFDKTGTLTKGFFEVAETVAMEGFSKEEVLALASSVESHSNHPIALSIKRASQASQKVEVSDYQELSGYGVSAKVEGRIVLAGNAKLMKEQGVSIPSGMSDETLVYVALEGRLAGYLILRDEIKPEAASLIERLKNLGIKQLVMLTGDKKESAQKVAQVIGITSFEAELLPHEKVERFEALLGARATQGKSVFVGDGINDAPVLALSDVGIAMGGVGSDAAIEAADVVIMNDEIGKVATAIAIAQKTHTIVWQNIIFALGVKGAILIMGAFGVATMWEAVFGDVGVALIAVLNATRVMNLKES